jgi:sugar phosphate isomerase/epimerase
MAVIERLAELGYDGIEFVGLFGRRPVDIKRKLDSCGLTAIGNHVPFNEFAGNINKVVADHKELGCRYITIAMPESSGLPGGGNYARTIEVISNIGEAVSAAGMTLLYHNHAEELRSVTGGKSVLEHLLDDNGALSFEADIGWIQIGGADPMYYLDKYQDRCPIVHFKDYMPAAPGGNEDFYFRPTGYGIVPNAELYAKTRSFKNPPAWYVMDHDCAYGRDIYWDMDISINYFRNLMKIHG